MRRYDFTEAENQDEKAHQRGQENRDRTLLALYDGDDAGNESGYAWNGRKRLRVHKCEQQNEDYEQSYRPFP